MKLQLRMHLTSTTGMALLSRNREEANCRRCFNVGAQSRIAATFIEKDAGFWASYLMALCFICLSLVILMVGQRWLGFSNAFLDYLGALY